MQAPTPLLPARDYSKPTVVSLQELFGTSDIVDQGFVEKHKNEHHLFGPKSLSSYLQRKLKNEALPEFDLTKEASYSSISVIVAGIVPGDVEPFGRAHNWVLMPWQSGAGSSVGRANSWRPSWFKFKDNLGRSYFILAVWPGVDIVQHYALTVCCNYPVLARQLCAWYFPEVDRDVWQYTRLSLATSQVTDAVVVLGESSAIRKQLIEHYHFVPQDFSFDWYSVSVFMSQYGQRVVLLQVTHPYWGSIAGQLAIELFRAGCKELVHCGNIGRLAHNSAQTLTVISAPQTACHVSKLSEFQLNQKFLDWLHNYPPANTRLFKRHKHISIASPILETKEQSEKWADSATIDVEVYALAEAASKFNRPLSCLHYVSDVVTNTQSLGEKWEDIPESGIKEAKAAMIVCIASYLAQLGSFGSTHGIPSHKPLGVGEKRSREDPAAGTRKARRDESPEIEAIEPANPTSTLATRAPAKEVHILAERPVQLLVFDRARMILTEEGKKALEVIAEKKLCIVGIIGKFRTGKSYLLNQLLSKTSSEGFKETPGRQGCTAGVQMMWKKLSEGRILLLLDTQGLSDSKQSGNTDAPLFVLIARMSSLLLLNTKHVIDNATLDQLSCVGELALSMQLTSFKETNMTILIWLVREAMPAEDGEDDDSYLEGVLQPVGDTRSDELRNSIKSCFPERRFVKIDYGVSLPVRRCVCLDKLTDAPYEKFEALKQDILRSTPTKMVSTTRDGSQIELNGRSFGLLLEVCISLLNERQYLDFGSACAGIPSRICELAALSALLLLETETAKLEFPMATKHLSEAVASVEDNCLANYDREAYVGGTAKDENLKQLRHKFAERLERLIRDNHDASRIQCENLLASRFDELRNLQGRLEVTGPLVVIKSQDDFSKVVGILEEFYHANAIGPAVEEVWAKHESTTLIDMHKNAYWTFKFDKLRLQQDAAIRASEARMREEIGKREIESQRKLNALADQNRRNQQMALRDRQQLVSEKKALQSVIDQHEEQQVYGSYMVNRKARCGAITQSGARCLMYATSRPRGRCHHHVDQ